MEQQELSAMKFGYFVGFVSGVTATVVAAGAITVVDHSIKWAKKKIKK